jgi:hypothetical protein
MKLPFFLKSIKEKNPWPCLFKKFFFFLSLIEKKEKYQKMSQKGVRKVNMPHPDITAEMLAELATERIRQKKSQPVVSAPVSQPQPLLQKFKKLANAILNPNCIEEEEERKRAEKKQKQFMIATICLAGLILLLMIVIGILYKRRRNVHKK